MLASLEIIYNIERLLYVCTERIKHLIYSHEELCMIAFLY